ncbi:hypothetical protein AB0M47_07700 [Hamadaea sp. NPDC051192]|uniref:hypothetical protein n=1 Tax=Hamadaea sp. NPDC051192 TaxID=3154940 RepID=UPI00341B54CB
MLLVGTLVLALLLGIGGWAGLTLMAAAGPQAAEITPGDVVAFTADGDVRVDDKDLTNDVTPWLGGRFGAALWVHDTEAYTLLVAASRDDRKAREGLERLRGREGSGKFGFVVGDGYVVTARGTRDAQAAAEAANAAAQATPLAGVQAYADAVKWLPEEHFAHAYADLAEAGEAMTAMMMSQLTDLGMDEEEIPEDVLAEEFISSDMFFGVPGLTGKQQGTLVVGASATDDGVEVRYRTFGAAATMVAPPAADLIAAVGGLSADAIVAGSAAIGKVPEGLDGFFGPTTLDPEDLEGLDPKQIAEIQAEFAKAPDFSKAIKALDSSFLAFAVTGVRGEVPMLSATLRTKDAAASADVAAALKSLEMQLTVTVTGNTVQAVSDGYTATAKLSSSPLFQKAIEGLPSHPDLLVYVDLPKYLAPADDARMRDLAAPIKALAFASAPLGSDSEGMVHLIIE